MWTFWLASLFLYYAAQVYATDYVNTNGASGELCGSHRCVTQATCQNGECVCQSPYSGVGNFHCHRPTDYFTAVFNDPMVRAFDGSHTNVPLINQFPLAVLDTGTCANSTYTEGNCYIQVYAWASRVRGKTFIHGYTVAVAVSYGEFYDHSFTLYTSAESGNYSYVDINPGIITIPDHAPITTTYDEVNNFARINLEACGADIGIRGAEVETDPLLIPAGVYVTVRSDCGLGFLSPENTLGFAPPGLGITLNDYTQQLSLEAGRPVSGQLAMLYNALNDNAFIDQDLCPEGLHTLGITVAACNITRVFDALEQCLFIIDSPRFVKCYEQTENGDDCVELMTECISAICNSDGTACQAVKHTVLDSNCVSGIKPNQTTILDNPCGDD